MKPELAARFVLDGQGEPQWIEADYGYWIELFIVGAPADTRAVVYELHDSYYDPLRESRDKKGFREEISSYGDYTIRVELRRPAKTERLSRTLSSALKAGHKADRNDAIEKAIRDIEAN